jgi:hypothetical protein
MNIISNWGSQADNAPPAGSPSQFVFVRLTTIFCKEAGKWENGGTQFAPFEE